ncbi:MAG: DUF1868 domain-containing protein [Legionella sp.]|nr:DUF1868 domain-containing protein [Legionella sp.]
MPKTYRTKINNQGQYTIYPGITTIATIQKQDDEFWQKIHNMVKIPLISDYFAPLPYESYHMTTINLYTERDDGGEDWGHFVTKKLAFFKALHADLAKNAFQPTIKLQSIKSADVLQLCVEIAENQKASIETVAKTFDLQTKIPKVFHITLAYQYKLTALNHRKKIKHHLEEHLEQFFAERSPLQLNSPSLTYFNDMTAFTPWDALSNPFISISAK